MSSNQKFNYPKKMLEIQLGLFHGGVTPLLHLTFSSSVRKYDSSQLIDK